MKFIILLLAWWELYRNTGSWWNPQDSSLHIILSETYLLHQKAIFVVTAIKYFKHSLVTVIFDLWTNIKVNALNDNWLSVDAPYSPWAFHTTRCKLWMLRWFNRYCFIQVYITTTIWKLKKNKWKNVMWLANELLKENSLGFRTLCLELTDVMSHCLKYCMSKKLQAPYLPTDRPHFLTEIWVGPKSGLQLIGGYKHFDMSLICTRSLWCTLNWCFNVCNELFLTHNTQN